jgi:hypothetical protein
MPFILYQRDDCQLCDEALTLLAEARIADLECTWIDDQPAHEARYGVRVPVLRNPATGDELDWPFDRRSLAEFLGRG